VVLTAVVMEIQACLDVTVSWKNLDYKYGGDMRLRNSHNYLPADTMSRPNGLSLQELNPCRRTYLFIDHADYPSVSISNDFLFSHLHRIIESIFILQNVHEIKDDAHRIALLIQVTQRVLLFAERNKQTFLVTGSQFERTFRTQIVIV